MDPNETLELIRGFAAKAIRQNDEGQVIDTDDAYSLAHLVTALDLWLSNGGFPPAAWCRFQPTNPQGSN